MVTDALNATPRPQLWRISDRRSFQALRGSRARGRSGPCSVTFVPDPGTAVPPRVGFAVGKRTGGAVVRNRIKRRLRAALRDLQAAGRLPRGTYLVGATAVAASLPYLELVADLGDAVDTATRAAA